MGSLLFSVPIEYDRIVSEYTKKGVERKFPYCDYQFVPKSPWNYGYADADFEISYNEIGDIPFSQTNPPLTIKANFLGAHGIPMEYRGRQEEYVDLVINEMMPLVATENLADFVDVFCDKGFFTVEDTERVLMAGIKYGMRPKIHANEMAVSGGVQVGVKYGAISVDHLEQMGMEEIEALKGSETMPTVLPGCAFFLNLPLSPVRDMINAGLPVAMASDFNPGTSPSGNMQFIMSAACIRYKMTPEEAFNATTLNTAYAMDVSHELGSITKGKLANVIITQPMNGLEFMPYYYGANKVEKVVLQGKIVK